MKKTIGILVISLPLMAVLLTFTQCNTGDKSSTKTAITTDTTLIPPPGGTQPPCNSCDCDLGLGTGAAVGAQQIPVPEAQSLANAFLPQWQERTMPRTIPDPIHGGFLSKKMIEK